MSHTDHSPTTPGLAQQAHHEVEDAKARLASGAQRMRAETGSAIKTLMTDALDGRRTRISGELRALSHSLRKAADGTSDSATHAAPLAHKAAQALDSLSRRIETQSAAEIGRSITQYGRSNPALFVGGCLLAGLAVGRLLFVQPAQPHDDRRDSRAPNGPDSAPANAREQHQRDRGTWSQGTASSSRLLLDADTRISPSPLRGTQGDEDTLSDGARAHTPPFLGEGQSTGHRNAHGDADHGEGTIHHPHAASMGDEARHAHP